MSQLFLTVLIPFFGAVLILGLPKRYRPYVAVTALGLTFVFSLATLFITLRLNELYFHKFITSWLSISFTGDGLAVFMAAVSSFVAFLISIYSLEYMSQTDFAAEFYFWMLVFVGSMMGLVFSANLILLYCFWEMTAVCSWRLIGFYRKEKDIKAADRAFLVTFVGASLMLAGIVLVYISCGTLDIAFLKGKTISNLAALLLLAGIISKSAQLPFQTWLPDAGVAPTPVTALLHAAVLVKIGVYVFARLFGATFFASVDFTATAIAISSITIIVGGAAALVENNIKRILAYSTISQLGYILLVLSISDGISLQIGLLYVLAHSLAKAGLFLCAGIIEHKTKTKDLNELGGLLKTMPLTAAAYLLCAFSIIGLPPFLGFWPKLMTILLSFKRGHFFAGYMALIGALFTLFYLMRLFNKAFLGDVNTEASKEASPKMVGVVLTLGFLSFLLGILVKLPLNILTRLLM